MIKKLKMPNGEIIENEYQDSADWARSWSIRYPDTGEVGTTGEQDWELVERHGLTAILEAALSQDHETGEIVEGSQIGRILRDIPDETFRSIAESRDVGTCRTRVAELVVDVRQALTKLPVDTTKYPLLDALSKLARIIPNDGELVYYGVDIGQLARTAMASGGERSALDKVDLLRDALSTVRSIIVEGAVEGFNPLAGDWAERLFLSQQKSSAAMKATEPAP